MLINAQWKICPSYSEREQVQQYIKSMQKFGTRKQRQRTITATEKVWTVGWGQTI